MPDCFGTTRTRCDPAKHPCMMTVNGLPCTGRFGYVVYHHAPMGEHVGTSHAGPPHPLSQKEARVAKAGIFNAPYGLHVTAEIFYQSDALEQLEAFVSLNGAARYGHEPSSDELRLVRNESPVDDVVELITTAAGDQVRLFGVGEAALWSATVV